MLSVYVSCDISLQEVFIRKVRLLYFFLGNKSYSDSKKFARPSPSDDNEMYSSPNIITMIKSRRVKWAGHVVRMGENRNAYKILVGRPEGKRPLGRARHRWVDNIKIDHREIGWDGVDWIDLAQDRDQWRALVNTVMNLPVP
jgi:hypothetical protein